ncbi:SGNH/GDSL hydrolase family protein [Geminisphaera colitermitum]|uniref:SGNH/GDSL hydrolase family protein n=1 Tax=Geminisphaera colitermitum TaxID=1148786 RepID=UPI0005B9F3FB|nr:SGNH/GDSL hydrolase family protein [Geminisphaera colitermitum]
MPLILQPNDTLLFYGDSITDCGRDRSNLANLGGGYVNYINAQLGHRQPSATRRVINTGISGNRIYDLEQRLEADLLAHKPTVVTFLIGINDTWRRYDSKLMSPAPEFYASFHRILDRITSELTPAPRLVVMEPFLLPTPEDRRAWREDLDPRITAVRNLAVEFGADLIPLDGLFASVATRVPAPYWLPDGVHPSTAGHALIADAWLKNAGV